MSVDSQPLPRRTSKPSLKGRLETRNRAAFPRLLYCGVRLPVRALSFRLQALESKPQGPTWRQQKLDTPSPPPPPALTVVAQSSPRLVDASIGDDGSACSRLCRPILAAVSCAAEWPPGERARMPATASGRSDCRLRPSRVLVSLSLRVFVAKDSTHSELVVRWARGRPVTQPTRVLDSLSANQSDRGPCSGPVGRRRRTEDSATGVDLKRAASRRKEAKEKRTTSGGGGGAGKKKRRRGLSSPAHPLGSGKEDRSTTERAGRSGKTRRGRKRRACERQRKKKGKNRESGKKCGSVGAGAPTPLGSDGGLFPRSGGVAAGVRCVATVRDVGEEVGC